MTFKHKLSCRLALIRDAILAATVVVAACELPTRPPLADTVSRVIVTPSVVVLPTNDSIDLIAVALTATDDTVRTGLVWTASSGAFTDTTTNGGLHKGRYRPPSAPGQYKVKARNGSASDSATVTVSTVSVASVTVSPATASVTVGAAQQFTAVLMDSAGNPLSSRVTTWLSTDPAVATVNASGLAIGIALGTATIVVTSEGKAGSATITVTPEPVASVTVSPASASILVGATRQLSVVTKDAAGNPLTGRVVTWSSSNTAVVTVSGSGLVTGTAAGSATITATSEGQSGSATINVTPVPVASVTVSPAAATILVGATQQLSAATKDSAGNTLTGRVVTWSSSNAAVASVNNSGLVTGNAAGSVTITATSEGKGGSATITISNVPVASVTVNPAAASILVGATQPLSAVTKDSAGNTLTGRVVTWSSSNTTVATVSSSGLVTGRAAGSATITATSEGKSGGATITVTPVPVASVTVSPASASIVVGATQQLSAVTKDSAGNTLTGRVVSWSSGDTVVATVSPSGLVTARAAGSAIITATSEGKSGTAAITTIVPVASVTVSPASATIAVGATRQLSAVTKDAAGNTLTGRVVTWASSNSVVATVSGTGLVTGRAAGSATITATSEGKSGTTTITVTLVPVATVTVSPASAGILVGGTQQLSAVTKDSAGNTLTGRVVTWASSNTAVATVSASGLVTGVGAGSATITATSEGKSGSAAITVTTPPPPPPPPPPGLACVDTVAPAVPAAIRTFYVDAVAGNNTADGLTLATAWKTLAKANATARAGDLFLLSGVFTNQVIDPPVSGTASAKIVYRARPGASAMLDGPAAGTSVLLDGGVGHIVIDGLEIRNADYPIQLQSGAHHNWLRNLQVHDVGAAVQFWGSSDNRIEDSDIRRCGDPAPNSGDCIWVTDGSHRNVIVRNIMAFGGHGLIDIGGDRTGIQPSRGNVVALNDLGNTWSNNLGLIGYARGTIIECNRIHSASTSGLNYERAGMSISADSNVIRFNEIFDNMADGIQIQGYNFSGLVQNARGNLIYHNTIWGNGGAGFQLFQSTSGVVSGNFIENNIIWGNNTSSDGIVNRSQNGSYWDFWVDLYHANTGWTAGTLNGNVIRNNIAAKNAADIGQGWIFIIVPGGTNNRSYTMAQAEAALPNVAANLQVDPLFVNVGARDFHLLLTSLAIDAGRIIPGVPYLGLAPDLGAREMR
jgi:uncharacterized protein YjdB